MKRQIAALADAVVCSERVDRHLVRPVLLAMLHTAVTDFNRYYGPEHAAERVRDHELLTKRAISQAGQ